MYATLGKENRYLWRSVAVLQATQGCPVRSVSLAAWSCFLWRHCVQDTLLLTAVNFSIFFNFVVFFLCDNRNVLFNVLMLQLCAPGYNRHLSGPWLGLCSKDREPCRPGTYGDPPRIPCEACPCPLTNPGNQWVYCISWFAWWRREGVHYYRQDILIG